MTPCLPKLATPLLCIVLFGTLSGCAALALMAAESSLWVYEATQKKNNEPIIMASNENKIKIKHRSVGSKAELEQVKQLMSEHCNGAYVETSRTELRGYDTVEAECTHRIEPLQ